MPAILGMHLRDYKVRILDQNAGTGATTRVLIRSTDGEREWDTVGVSANVIEASWMAMEDAYATAFRYAADGDVLAVDVEGGRRGVRDG
jgi:2-isopropylmalate synthase